MTRLLSLTLGLFVVAAPAWGETLILREFPGRGGRGPSTPRPPQVTRDKDGNLLYSGRPLAAWVGDLTDKDVLIREEAIEIIAEIGRPARSATADLRKLLKADNRNLRIRAALAVWKVGGDSRGVPEILAEGLKDASSAVRREALVALGTIGPDAAVAAAAVVDCLDDADHNLRNQAAETLRQLGQAATPALLACLKSKSPIVRQNALLHIGVTSLGKEHVPALTVLLRDDTLRCRVEAGRVLWAMGETGAPTVAALLEGVKAPGDDLQPSILQTIIASTERPKTLLPLLQVCLDGTNVYNRVQAARVLFDIEKKPQRVLPIYLEILRDPAGQNQGYASYAISALIDLKADALPALPRLVELMKTPNYYVSYDARTVLANIGTPAVAPLVEIIQSGTLPPNSQGYEIAIGALSNLGPPAAKAVLPLLSSRDDNVRVRAIRVVSGLGANAKDAVPKLIEAIGDRSIAVRDAALQALGSLGDAALPAVPRLVEMARDRDVNVRMLSLQTLASIRPDAKDILPLCLPLLRDPNTAIRLSALQLLVAVAPRHRAIVPAALKLLDDPAMRQSALGVIGSMGAAGAKAVPRVANLLADPDENTKRAAAYALSNIGPAAKSAAPALLHLLQSGDANTVSAAAYALHGVKPDAGASLPKLIDFLEKCRDGSAIPILNILAHAGKSAQRAYPAVLAIRDDSSRLPGVRATAALALARIDPARAKKDASAPMRRLLALPDQKLVVACAILTADPDDKEAIALFDSELASAATATRMHACTTLGQIGPAARRFLPRIREQRKDKDVYLRSAAALAAYQITRDAREALPTLEAMLADASQPYARGYAAYYLGDVGLDARGLLPKLRALRSGGDSYARSNAAIAVQKIEKAVEAASPPKSPDPDENP